MATAVERPMSALTDIQANLERNSRRNSIEIIDVDEIDELAPRPSSSQRPLPRPRHQQRREPETITILDDSDDEIQILGERQIRPLPQRRGRFQSPPPLRELATIPPVPAVPRPLAPFQSFPMARLQRNPSLNPAAPVRANPAPLGFEVNIAPRHRQHSHHRHPQQPEAGPSNLFNPRAPRRNPHPMTAAPPSHHAPAMGLGGALISSNRSRAAREAIQAARHVMLNRSGRRRPHRVVDAADLLFSDDEEGDIDIHWLGGPHEQFLRLADRFRGRDSPASLKYQKSYTHPDTPEPGFTFDFSLPSPEDEGPRTRFFPPTSASAPIIVDDDDATMAAGPSSSSHVASTTTAVASSSDITALLVCARCSDPLLLNESLGPDDEGKRVWALRCGHMIDQKCLNEIGVPEDDPEALTFSAPVDKKGKGKAKVKQQTVAHEPEPEDNSTLPSPDPVTTIRSRLRSAASSSSSSTPPQLPARPPAKRRRTNANMNHATRSIEAEYEWKCPVTSCGREHASVKIDGIWGPEKEGKLVGGATSFLNNVLKLGMGSNTGAREAPRGAIQIFA